MLLKYSQAQKRIKATGIGKPQRTAGGMVKLTSGLMTVVPKIHRRVVKVANKRPAAIHRTAVAAVKRERIPVDPCENSNDSGLGFDHHLDYPHHSSLTHHPGLEPSWPGEEPPDLKRRRLEIKLESDDANDNFTFQEAVRQQAICVPVRRVGRPAAPLTLSSQLLSASHDGRVQLVIMCQPEQQHRARYQTEGSRGAVKDRTGNGFPVVKLVGYDRPATLQVFIGTDQGKVAPHMFYQACRVSGKNSTPCIEKKIDGTIVIEVDIEPTKDMVVTCDCVGILKERNVDVEHRFPEEGSGRSKKKSTRCRMVFRTTITHPDGSQETLQVTSQPIVCTQPPGVPEICKKSLSSCGARGGQELFILGKNFLKDTRVVFQEGDNASPAWVQAVQPDKEFLQQSHLVCVVPPYRTVDITEPVTVRLVVESSGKASEPHVFLYLPEGMRANDNVSVVAQDRNLLDSSVSSQVKFLKASGAYRGPLLTRRRYRNGGRTGVYASSIPLPVPVAAPLLMPTESSAPFMPAQTYAGKEEKVHPVMMWNNKSSEMMMPPPPPGLLPIAVRRSSVQMIVPDPLAPEDLKREVPETVTESSKSVSDISEHQNSQASSVDTFHRYVNNSSLPSINVGNYLSNIEGSSRISSEVPRIMIPSPVIVNKQQLFSTDSSNLLTTADPILTNQSSAMSFESRSVSASSASRESMSVIVNSAAIPKQSPDSLINQTLHKELSGTQNISSLNILISPVKQSPSATERLDAFVNSAAESHISPTPTSPVVGSVIDENSRMNMINDMVMADTNDLNKMQETNAPQEIQTQLQISPRLSPHRESTNLNEGPLHSLISSSSQTSSNQIQSMTTVQNNLEQHLNNQNMNQANMANLMHSPPQTSPNQSQQFSTIPSPIEQHISPHISPQINAVEINNMMQSAQQNHSNQSLAGFQASLEQQLSSHMSVNTSQMNDTDLNNLIQNTNSQSSANQVQELNNIQASLEQQLSAQAMNPTQISQCDMNRAVTLIQSSCSPPNQVEAISNLQASLEHMPNQTVSSGQILHSESIQSNNMGMEMEMDNSMNNSIQTSSLISSGKARSLSNIQAALEHHLSSQGIGSVQSSHESMAGQSITLDTLNGSVTASQIQAAVSQGQTLSDFQATIQQQLSSQVMGSPASELGSSSNSPNIMNSQREASPSSINQNSDLTNMQMSFEHVSSQVLNSNQQSLDSLNSSTMSLSNSMQTPQQSNVAVTESQVFSDLQTSYNHHLNGNITSSAASQTLERLTNTLQNTSESPSEQTIQMMQTSGNHISPVATTSNRVESLTTNDLSINNSQIIDLRSSVSMMSSQSMNTTANPSTANSPNILSSPNSLQSPSSALTSPGISMCSTPTMALSPNDLANSQGMDAGKQNIILNSSPQPILTSELSMNNPSTLPLGSGEVRMQNSQCVSIQSTAMSGFDGVTQSLPVQVSSMTQYDQRQQMVNTNNEGGGKYMISSGSAISRPQTTEQTAKKCEEGMLGVPHELTQMSEHDLISYINPSCFDTV